ncbi:MAG TPA: HPr family phosphocarrier protein [Halothiobacillaceae bacterium]|nr:HPr family phosphocarrier protein [Halothiobacillaceae bacterium]
MQEENQKHCQSVTLCNRRGLHARAAARFAATADPFPGNISVEFNDRVVNGKSIMGLMMLAAAYEKTITICCEHPEREQCEQALSTLVELVENRFDESE